MQKSQSELKNLYERNRNGDYEQDQFTPNQHGGGFTMHSPYRISTYHGGAKKGLKRIFYGMNLHTFDEEGNLIESASLYEDSSDENDMIDENMEKAPR